MTVGFVVRDVSSPVFAEIALGAETVLRAAGYVLLLANSEGDPGLDATHLATFRKRRADGILLSLVDESDNRMLQELARLSVPYVLIDRELGNGDSPSAVLTDHAAGARTAADHLLALGHRRLGLLGAPQEIRPGRERAAGVRSACGAFPKAEALIASVPFTVQAGQIALDEMLDSKDPPTALLIGGNQLLPVALQVLHERNLDIPADISLVVFDGGPLTRLLSPAIANVSRALDLVGRKAAELLLRLLEGGEPEQILIPMTFDPGASCAPPKERTRRRRQARDNAK